ncbi:cytochrome d ubiquinol oxidase subunit II [Metabacillus iocasae]|uniref:Cytochrome d ubiquinol oxidase subunit II n=1 Tax=Priestia iocasae TaxID=2291674 RepID=A0ABS2R1E2_9BACI|nr:cytochrome d ubiquinol oxidase subunit II [Metabacillus iocasae]MBM7704821.1 cytochrome d ubiquinol oxidase subunit II [Metabacillus iocasae]
MTDSVIAITVVWGFIFIYALMGTMDFGAGFWSMVYINRDKTNATNIANTYLSPTWEVTNVFIVAIVVALFSFFPGATFTLGTVLLIPGSIILLLLALRSGFLVFANYTKGYRHQKALTYISGISGVLIPAFLICVLPISQGGFIDTIDGNQKLNLIKVFTSPNVYAFIGFAVSSSLFLSSLLLADYSKSSDELRAYDIYRRDALITGPLSLIMAALIMVTMRNEANWLFSNMMDFNWALFASVAMFVVAGVALIIPYKGQKGMPRLAVVAVLLQYFFASYAYGRGHLPYIVYPEVTIETGFTHPNAFRALFISYIVGFAILFPGFYYFWRLFMKQNKEYVKKKPY